MAEDWIPCPPFGLPRAGIYGPSVELLIGKSHSLTPNSNQRSISEDGDCKGLEKQLIDLRPTRPSVAAANGSEPAARC